MVKDKYGALIVGVFVSLANVLAVFGVSVFTETRVNAISLAILAALALAQGIITRGVTTDNAVVVAKVTKGKHEAVAGDASVYDNGTELQTVPAEADQSSKDMLLAGESPAQVVGRAMLDSRYRV